MSSHTSVSTVSLTISSQSLLRLRVLLILYRRQYLDVSTWMSHSRLYPSRAKSEPTRDAISPPPSAKLARMVLLSTLLVKAANCQSPILFQSMPLLLRESLKTCLKHALSKPPNLFCEPLQQAGEAWAAPTKLSGSHLKPWSPCFADAQARGWAMAECRRWVRKGPA